MHVNNPQIHPERALLTPTWLGSLALLVANDHWLKGSGLLPGVLTGKLSDFAGLLMAPVLLATLLRVRTHRGLLACHIATGAVFAGIQLSTGFADLWSGAMGLIGHPWVITSDLTDLIALPCLWLSWRLLIPAMDPERPALVGLQRSAVAGTSVFGLWATVATSDDGGSYDECDGWCDSTEDGTGGWETDDGGGEWEDVEGQVYIHNPNGFAINLNIRVLRSDVELDCSAIASDPGRLLPDAAFGPAEHWELPPTTNVGVRMPLACGAAKIAGEGIPEQIIFSNDFSGVVWFPGSHATIDELRSDGGAAIVLDGVSNGWVGGEQWRHTPKLDSDPQPEPCLEDAGERHLDWSEMPGYAVAEVLSLAAGLDGCHEIELQPAGGEPFTWYLCAPESSIRLEIGELWRFESSTNAIVVAQLVDPVSEEVLVDDLGRPMRTLRWERALSNVATIPVAVQAVDNPSCPWTLDDDCLEVARKLDLQLDGIAAAPGVPTIHVDEQGMRHELTVGRARSLALTAGECGSDALPYDIEYALVSEPNL
jgi:hypothetical protein